MTQSDFIPPPTMNVNLSSLLVNGSVTVNGNVIGSDNGQIVVRENVVCLPTVFLFDNHVKVRPSPFGGGVVSVGGIVYAGGNLIVQVNQSGTFAVIVSQGGFVGSFSSIQADPSTLPQCYVGDTTGVVSDDGSVKVFLFRGLFFEVWFCRLFL
jgi:hypothetical protein